MPTNRQHDHLETIGRFFDSLDRLVEMANTNLTLILDFPFLKQNLG